MNAINSPLPTDYPRRILLAVAARTPQIVTETLYALSQQQAPAYYPTELHIITTCKGAESVQRGLYEEKQLQCLQQDYQLPPFAEQQLHIICDANGQSLLDVRTREDNEIAADFISQLVQRFTTDENSSLVVSLSGGRRTMTYYIGYAVSLFGREQDRLTHVLIEEEYFFSQEFYYPPPSSRWVCRADGSGFDAADVEVTLADIPFVRLRQGLPRRLLSGQLSFNEAIRAAQSQVLPKNIEFHEATLQLYCAGHLVDIKGVDLAFYLWMLERRAMNLPAIRADDDNVGFAKAFLAVYQRLFGKNSNWQRVSDSLAAGMEKKYFDERKSRIRKKLIEALADETLAAPYCINSQGNRPKMRFGISLEQEHITFK